MGDQSFTSADLLALLKTRHSEDVFVPECKDGPTQLSTHFRMDAWVMAKSWAHPCVTAYEIKVSRSDFLRDQKWDRYLAYCNRFYFVAPKGLIKIDELHDGVGLMEVASNGRSLRAIRQAKYRDVVIPEDLFRYILMCRARIGADVDPLERRTESIRRWAEWLAAKSEAQLIGAQISRKVAEHVRAVEGENRQLKSLMATYDAHREQLRAIGVNPDQSWAHLLQSKINEAKNCPAWLEREIRDLAEKADRIKRHFLPEEVKQDA